MGGGPTPESTESDPEQDIDLVRQALPAPGVVLFAGGSGSGAYGSSIHYTRVTPWGRRSETCWETARVGRAATRPHASAAERATLDNLEARLSAALVQGGGPLTVYVAAHGEQGQQARHNSVTLWGGRSLDVARLAELHD